jgi:hypothetical protein
MTAGERDRVKVRELSNPEPAVVESPLDPGPRPAGLRRRRIDEGDLAFK